MGELVELDVTTVEESVTVNVTEEGQVDIAVFAEKGDTGPAGPAGPNSVTSATSSDGTAQLTVDYLEASDYVAATTQLACYGSFVVSSAALSTTIRNDGITDDRTLSLPDRSGTIALTEDYTGGTATIDVLDATVQGTLTADHIHGNLAGSVYAHIRAGENLAKGDPVYVSGSHGSGSTLIPVVSKADASNAAKMPAVGVMDAAVSNNQNGHMVITGTITELNTNAYPVNTVLYVATGGGWTSTPPAANSQAVAIVERSNNNNGAVIVKVNGLGSSGGNGAADANKLVRYDSTGGASLTGGTLTDMTYAGTAAFTSTTRPTSAGTGTPAATSLITRADGDARFGSIGLAGSSAISITSSITPQTIRSAQLDVGVYYVRMLYQLSGTANTGTRHGFDFSGTATVRFFRSRATSLPYVQVTSYPFSLGLAESTTSAVVEGIINVTVAGTFSMQAAQNTSHPDVLSVIASSHMIITPCPNGSIS